jgi:hypothetical protein
MTSNSLIVESTLIVLTSLISLLRVSRGVILLILDFEFMTKERLFLWNCYVKLNHWR